MWKDKKIRKLILEVQHTTKKMSGRENSQHGEK